MDINPPLDSGILLRIEGRTCTMKKSLHCRPLTVPMALPALAQFDVDSPPPFDDTCATTGPVSALQTKICAIDNTLEMILLFQRQIPFVKGHGIL